jgi:hypothetical protein
MLGEPAHQDRGQRAPARRGNLAGHAGRWPGDAFWMLEDSPQGPAQAAGLRQGGGDATVSPRPQRRHAPQRGGADQEQQSPMSAELRFQIEGVVPSVVELANQAVQPTPDRDHFVREALYVIFRRRR